MHYIEQTIKKCGNCKERCIHQRSNSRMGALGWLVNIILILMTAGLWLLILIPAMLLTKKIGGWECTSCGNREW